MNTEWQTIAAVAVTQSDPQPTAEGVSFPQVEVSVTGELPHIHMATLGPAGDAREARMTAPEARELAEVLAAAAQVLEARQ